MKDLDQFPSLQSLAEAFDELGERDAARQKRGRRASSPGRWGSVPRTPAPVLAGVAAAAVAIAAGTYAVPATRAAVGDLYGELSGWTGGDDAAAPGRSIAAGEPLPDWARAGQGDKRVLAEADGQKLYVVRNGDKLTFGINGFAEEGTISDLRSQFDGQKINVLTPGEFVEDGRHDRRPVFGLAAASVKRVEFNYADGSPPAIQDNLDGAFAVTIDAKRRAKSLTGYDADGKLIATFDLDRVGWNDFRYCPSAAGCPPWPK